MPGTLSALRRGESLVVSVGETELRLSLVPSGSLRGRTGRASAVCVYRKKIRTSSPAVHISLSDRLTNQELPEVAADAIRIAMKKIWGNRRNVRH